MTDTKREIKFRAWLIKRKAMAGVYTLGLTGIEYTTVSVSKELWSGVGNEDMVLMQYTGLSDKNGKDIYEGDVVTNVKFKDGSDYNNVNLHIYYENAHFGVGMANLSDVKELEVIGNMFENPDLIQ